MTRTYDRYTLEPARYGEGTTVYGWSTYARGSVLQGQPMKCFIGTFDSPELALKAYPGAKPSHPFMEPQVSLSHLPGEDDPVPGGMYPDDIDDGAP
jgi:hypothetical protein